MNEFFSNEKEKKIFEKVSNDSTRYLEMADKLKLAADTILKEYMDADDESKRNIEKTNIIKMGLYPIYLMLMGYTLENILKGLYISLGGKFFEWSSNGHNLESIVDDINKLSFDASKIRIIELKNDERDLLKKLKVYAEGKGRYPTVKKYEEVNLDKYDVNVPFHPEVKGYNEKFETRTYHWYNPKKLIMLNNGICNKYRKLLEDRLID